MITESNSRSPDRRPIAPVARRVHAPPVRYRAGRRSSNAGGKFSTSRGIDLPRFSIWGGIRCALEGTQIARPDRLALDRAIFSRSSRGGGGTVLVDTSGSMSLSADEVEKIVRAAGGAAVVAIYSGKGDEGELRVVARGDRRATSKYFKSFGAGNVVDLPALEWLAKQPEPRWWISDGCLTGADDNGCEVLLAQCLELVERARIERVDDAEAAIAALKSKS